MSRCHGSRSPGWQAFLRNHTAHIAGIDLFVVPTVGFKLLSGLVILRLERRQLVWSRGQPAAASHGHSRPADHATLTVAERSCWTVDWLDPTRVPRPCRSVGGTASPPSVGELRRLLKWGAHAPRTRQGYAVPSTRADSRACRISHLARRSPSVLRSDGIIGRHTAGAALTPFAIFSRARYRAREFGASRRHAPIPAARNRDRSSSARPRLGYHRHGPC